MPVLRNFPELRQTYTYDCGAKALQAVLAYYGIEVREDMVMKEARTNKAGTRVPDIIQTLAAHGLCSEARTMSLEDLKKEITDGHPVILVLQAWTTRPCNDWKHDWDDGHYVVAIGFDETKMLFEDPSSFERTYLPFQELLDRWHDIGIDGTTYTHYGIGVSGPKIEIDRDLPVHMD